MSDGQMQIAVGAGDQVLTGCAAKLLGVSSEMVKYLERKGQLTSIRIGHVRVFDRTEVERLARQRAK